MASCLVLCDYQETCILYKRCFFTWPSRIDQGYQCDFLRVTNYVTVRVPKCYCIRRHSGKGRNYTILSQWHDARSFCDSQSSQGVQWLSGRVFDSRPKDRRFEPHRRHCVVSLSKNINPSLELFQPRKTRPFITERLLMGRKESNQTITNKRSG